MTSSLQDLLGKTPEIAKDFVENFYKLFDHSRHMLKDLYAPMAKIVWDGQPIEFIDPTHCDSFNNFYLNEVPISIHDVRSVDGQPIPGAKFIIINASGFVSFGSSNPRPFTENFVIMFSQIEDTVEGRIVADCFRLLA